MIRLQVIHKIFEKEYSPGISFLESQMFEIFCFMG